MSKTITGLFDTYPAATNAVRDLEAVGVPHSDVSIVANNADGTHKDGISNDVTEDAGKGAGIGATVGGVGGLLTGLGLMAIPGVGPVVAAGWLAATAVGAVAGAAVGGTAGGIVGSLTGAGVPEDHAHIYAEGVRRGGTLVTAKVDDARVSAAEAVLSRHSAVNASARGQAYRDDGWNQFDAKAPPYTTQQIGDERQRYLGR